MTIYVVNRPMLCSEFTDTIWSNNGRSTCTAFWDTALSADPIHNKPLFSTEIVRFHRSMHVTGFASFLRPHLRVSRLRSSGSWLLPCSSRSRSAFGVCSGPSDVPLGHSSTEILYSYRSALLALCNCSRQGCSSERVSTSCIPLSIQVYIFK